MNIKKLGLIILLLTMLVLQGCGYELGYAAGTAQRYAGLAAERI